MCQGSKEGPEKLVGVEKIYVVIICMCAGSAAVRLTHQICSSRRIPPRPFQQPASRRSGVRRRPGGNSPGVRARALCLHCCCCPGPGLCRVPGLPCPGCCQLTRLVLVKVKCGAMFQQGLTFYQDLSMPRLAVEVHFTRSLLHAVPT